MDMVGEWAVKIAREVAPEEVDDAPLVVGNYIRGGKARRDLFKKIKGGEAGGSGLADLSSFFPVVIDAIKIAAPYLYASMATVGVVELGRNITGAKEHIKKKYQERQIADNTGKQASKIPPAPAAAPSTDPAIATIQSIESMTQTLHAAGLGQEQSTQKSAIVITLFAQDVESARQFLDKLAEKKQ